MAAGEPLFLQANDYSAKQLRQLISLLLNSRLFTDLAPSSSLVSAGGGHGVIGSSDLAVTEKSGTPNMSVDVAAGSAFIRGTQGADQGVYGGVNDATVNVVIAAADATNPRKDLIVAKVRDNEYGGGSNDLQITVIQGTAAASPVDPSVTEDTLVLARVDIPALDTAITNAQITDLRTRAYALGAVVPCTSTTRPNPAYTGQLVAETDTGCVRRYDGTNWRPLGAIIDRKRVVSGDSPLNNTAWTDIHASAFDLTVPAVAGDILEYTLLCYASDVASNLSLDVKNVTSGTRWLNTTLFSPWRVEDGAPQCVAGTIHYVVQSGDISGGNVQTRLQFRTDAAANATLYSSDPALMICLKNLGPDVG